MRQRSGSHDNDVLNTIFSLFIYLLDISVPKVI